MIETMSDLVEWVAKEFPYAIVGEIDGEIVISTGATLEMNGTIQPIEEEE